MFRFTVARISELLRPLLILVGIEVGVVGDAAAADPVILFREASAEAGLEFTHVSPLTPQRHLHLTMGSGLAWIDYDLDGRPDLYAVQGTPWTGTRQPPADGPNDALFRNRIGGFGAVSGARIVNRCYGMGVASGDFDNDGFPDLFVSNFGPDVLFHNNGDGTFEEVTSSPVLNHSGYGAGCTWLDVEPDGDLDLFVTNYVEIDDRDYQTCDSQGPRGAVAIACPPWKYLPAADRIYENDGAGNFRDRSAACGLTEGKRYYGLGVVAADFNSDGLTDLFVANDSNPNQMWTNAGGGRFDETGLLSGTALNREGKREAGMGVAAADVDGNGTIDLFLTHYYAESNTLYSNLGGGLFLDVTDEMGMAAPSRTKLAFGTVLDDFSGDGFPDCFIANGHIHDRLDRLGRDATFAQRPQIMIDEGGRRFRDVAQSAGGYFRSSHVGRGAASADYDRDGRMDLAVGHLNGPLALLHNETDYPGRGVSIALIGTIHARDPIGAAIVVRFPERSITLPYLGSSSYLSSNQRDRLVVVRPGEEIESIDVTWPGGAKERWVHPEGALPQFQLIEGSGRPISAAD